MMDEEEIEKLFEKILAEVGSLEEVAANYVFPPPKGYPKHDIRGIIKRSEELGRFLTADEADEFLIGYY